MAALEKNLLYFLIPPPSLLEESEHLQTGQNKVSYEG